MIMILILYSSYKKLNYQCCLVFIIFALYLLYTNLVYFAMIFQDGFEVSTANHKGLLIFM